MAIFKCLLFPIYPHVGVNNVCTSIWQCFKCSLFHMYPSVGRLVIAIFQMFTIWRHMFSEGVNNMFSFIYKYFKHSLFRIYSSVGVDNMCTFRQQYFNPNLYWGGGANLPPGSFLQQLKSGWR